MFWKHSFNWNLTCGWVVDKGILASRTSITTSINLSCSFSSFSVLAIWPGYHCIIPAANNNWSHSTATENPSEQGTSSIPEQGADPWSNNKDLYQDQPNQRRLQNHQQGHWNCNLHFHSNLEFFHQQPAMISHSIKSSLFYY